MEGFADELIESVAKAQKVLEEALALAEKGKCPKDIGDALGLKTDSMPREVRPLARTPAEALSPDYPKPQIEERAFFDALAERIGNTIRG